MLTKKGTTITTEFSESVEYKINTRKKQLHFYILEK